MISAIIATSSLISISAAFALLFRKSIAVTLPMSLFGIVLMLYFFGLVKLLEIGYYTVLLLSIMSIVYVARIILQRNPDNKLFIFNSALIIFLILLSISIYTNNNMRIFDWDWFAYWGKFVKILLFDNQLHIFGSLHNSFLSYPPFFMLLQYFFLKGSADISDQVAFFAANLVPLCIMMPFFSNASRKGVLLNIIKLFIAITIAAYTPYTPVYHTLYTDVMLSAMFGYALYIYFAQGINLQNFISISFVIMCLTLTKQTGFSFALIILAIIIMDLILFKRTEIMAVSNNRKKSFALGAMPLMAFIIAKLSWDLAISKTNAIAWTDNKYTINGLISIFTKEGLEPYQLLTLKNYDNAIWNIPLIGSLPLIIVSLIYVIASFFTIAFIVRNEDRIRYSIAFTILFLGMIAYSVLLVMNFVFGFSEYESINLASYSRYYPSYIVGMFIFLFWIPITIVEIQLEEEKEFISSKRNNKRKLSNYQYNTLSSYKKEITLGIITLLTITIFNSVALWQYILTPGGLEQYSQEIRQPSDSILKLKNLIDPKNDKLSFISIADNGYHSVIASYDLFPMELVGPESVGLEPYYEGDIYTQIMSAEDWTSMLLKEADFVFLYNINDQFISNYQNAFVGGLINIKESGLYKVLKNNEDQPCLKLIE